MLGVTRVKQLMEIERKCVHWNDLDICGQDCATCELVQDTEELLKAYDYVISVLAMLEEWRDTSDDRK